MGKTDGLTRVLAILGAGLCWLPILLTVLFSVWASVDAGLPLVDWFLPAELFPVILLGGVVLTGAAVRARYRWRPILLNVVLLVVFLLGGQALALSGGLADGRLEPHGWQWVTVLASIVLYLAAVIVLAIQAAQFVRDAWPPRPTEA